MATGWSNGGCESLVKAYRWTGATVVVSSREQVDAQKRGRDEDAMSGCGFG